MNPVLCICALCTTAAWAFTPTWTPTLEAEIRDGILVVDVPPGERREGFVGATAEVPMRGLRDFWMTVGFRRERAPEERATNEPPCRVRFDATVKERCGATHVRSTKWATVAAVTNAVPADTLATRVWCLKLGELEETMTVAVGIDNPSGRFAFDLRSFRVVDLRSTRRSADGASASVSTGATLPPQPASQRPQTLRGVMLPPQPLSEQAFDTLAEWGVTLVRFQIVKDGSAKFNIRDTAAYFRWLDSMLNRLERDILPRARARGIRVAVDLHTVPGGANRDAELNMFFEPEFADGFVEAWRRIATRLRGISGIYGYDLCNEPFQVRKSRATYWTLQCRAAAAIREIDPSATIIAESNEWDSPETYANMKPLPFDNVIYQAHMYLPLLYTHQGIGGNDRGLAYPDPSKGLDREWLRERLRPLREFQLRHGVRIYIGEFSAIAWAPGAAEYIRDCISIFDEYGWDWTYHAFREWGGWSVELEGDDIGHMRPSADNPRKRTLLEGLRGKTPAVAPGGVVVRLGAGSDSATIQAIVDSAVSRGEPAVIPSVNKRTGDNTWIVSEPIWLPSGSTLVLDNCRLRMADGVFCNCIANSKAWAPNRNSPESEEHDIRIVGLGEAVIDGGEFNGWGERTRPGGAFQEDVRAHVASLPKSLVHNCPIYLHNVRGFSISGIKIYHQRYWGVCCSVCSEGEIKDIRFEADLSWVSADGRTRDPNRRPNSYDTLWVKNGDGIDLRSGCHDILIENIEGFTEDDTIALSNIPRGRTAVADVVAGADPDIHHVTIRNVRGWCWRSMNLVRILSVDGGKIHDVDIDGVVELSPPGKDWRSGSAVQINDSRSEYRHKKRPETGDTRNISIANVSSCSGAAIRVFEGVENLRIENVTVTGGAETALLVKDDTIFRNCSIRGIECTETARIGSVIDLHNAHGDLSVSDVRAHSAKHVLRLSDSDIDVKLDGDKVEALSGERILRLERGDPDCGPDQPDLDSRIPVDKDGIFDVRSFGAKGDGISKDTAAIQRAIDAAATSGGGTVRLGAGVYLSGSIFLKGNVDFLLEEGATLKGSSDKADYNAVDVCPQNGASKAESASGAHLVLCIEQSNVSIRGKGTIDGNCLAFIVGPDGKNWPGGQGCIPWRTSQMVYFVECSNIRLEGVALVDSPYWSCFLHGCENVTVRNLRIRTRREPVHTHNGDGLDIDSCENVEVSGCDIDTADDGITLRALSKRLKKPRPCQNIRVSDCILSSSCNAVRVGVGDGIVRNASFSRITVRNTRTAVNFVSSWNTRSSGASFDGVSFDGMDVECMRFCRIYPFFSHSARFKGIRFANVTGTVRAPSWVTGRRDCPVGDVVFDDVRLSHGVVVHNANVSVKGGTLERIDPAEDVAVAYDAAIEKRNSFPGDMAIGGTAGR